ncbi:transcriptional regulator [Arthrobacter sp. CAN_A212]
MEAQKSFLAKKPQTVFRLTSRGRTAFRDQTTALSEIQRGLR